MPDCGRRFLAHFAVIPVMVATLIVAAAEATKIIASIHRRRRG
jgi:hypothetical protein